MSETETAPNADTCGYEDTQSGDPCEQPATHDDGRCWFHTEGSAYRESSVMFRLRGDVHGRLKAANDADETLSDTVGRALDALEREDWHIDLINDLYDPDAAEPKDCGAYHPLPCGLDVDCPETED